MIHNPSEFTATIKLAFTCPSGFSSPRQTALAGASIDSGGCCAASPKCASLCLSSLAANSVTADSAAPASNAKRCVSGCIGTSVSANASPVMLGQGYDNGNTARGGVGAGAAAVATPGWPLAGVVV